MPGFVGTSAVSEADCGRGNTRDAPRPSSMGSTHRSQSDSDRSTCYQESALLELPQNGCMHIFRDMELQGQGRCCLGCEIMTYRTLPGSPTGVWISLCRASGADLCSAPASITSSASLISQQSLPKPPSHKAKERGHGCLDPQLLGVAQGANWLGLVAWKWLTFNGTSRHRSRSAWLP